MIEWKMISCKSNKGDSEVTISTQEWWVPNWFWKLFGYEPKYLGERTFIGRNEMWWDISGLTAEPMLGWEARLLREIWLSHVHIFGDGGFEEVP